MFIGVDVSEKRGCAIVAQADDGSYVGSRWIAGGADAVLAALRQFGPTASIVAVGIDAPRTPLAHPRAWYWVRRKSAWRPRDPAKDRGVGRHCEVMIAATGLAHPQWTPLRGDAEPWMEFGFDLFALLGSHFAVHEVFPSASYTQTREDDSLRFEVSAKDLAYDPKDFLDACMAAATVREFASGRGGAVGGGDGLGRIVLPRPVVLSHAALDRWPG